METEQSEQESIENEIPQEQKSGFQFAPGSGFFVERIFIPEGISKGDVSGFLETQLEGVSPFNVEQLNWGAFLDVSGQNALLYAVFKDDTLTSESEEIHGIPVYPSFLPFLGYVADSSKVVCGVCEQTVSLLLFDEAGHLPAEIHSVEIEAEDFDDDFVAKVRADLLRELPHVSANVDDQIYHFTGLETDWKQHSLFIAEDSGGGRIETHLNLRDVFLSDIRERETKRRSFNHIRLSLALWLGSIGALSLMIFLSALSVGKLVWDIQIDGLVKKTVSQQAKVQQIEQKSRSLSVFEDGSSGRLQPLAMLEVINRLRPDGLFFSKVTAFEGKKMEIEGAAEQDGTTLVNRFKSDLSRSEMLSHFNLDITRISQGSTFFKLTIEFNDLELANVGDH